MIRTNIEFCFDFQKPWFTVGTIHFWSLNHSFKQSAEIESNSDAEEKNDMCNFYQALVKLPPITTLIGRVTDIIDLTCNREIIRNYNCYCHKLNFDGTYHHNVGYRPACCANYETNQKLIFVELNIREIREKFEIQSDKSNWQFYSNHSTSVFTPRMRNKLIPVAEKLRNTPLYSCFRTVWILFVFVFQNNVKLDLNFFCIRVSENLIWIFFVFVFQNSLNFICIRVSE